MSVQGDQIKSALGISALVSFYGIASLAVWFLGPSLGMGLAWQITIIALILLTWPFAILINHFRSKRAKKRAEVSAAAGDQQAEKSTAPPKRVYDELSRAAEEAVQWLRSSLLAGAKSNRAVYALPWFVVAGPPASGKTSLLLSSGLDFHTLPSQRRADHNIVRATRYCDWRVTDVGVFIDTAGRYQNDGPARDEWLALLDTIKKYRADRPLDGFLITVNAKRILLSSEAEIEQLAKTLRARLDELIHLARVRFPVYLLFTHLDSVNGFSDFFREGEADAGSEVFGVTIPLEKSPGAHALFDVEFDFLYHSLSRKRLILLQRSATAKARLNIFDFPWRFRDSQGKLGLFTSSIFRPNPFSESPLLRGFYFTASAANGDRTSSRTVAEADDERPAAAVGKGYFIDRFFREVLLRDKDLASSFQASRKHPPRLRVYLLAAAVLALLIFAVGAAVSFLGNHELLAEATERGARVEAIRHADLGKDVTKKEPVAARDEVEAVEALRGTLAKLDDYDRNSPPLKLRFGLYSGNAINSALRAIYFDSIQQRFVKPAGAALEQDLQSFANGANVTASAGAGSLAPTSDPSANQDDEDVLGHNYDLLKAYMMLADRSKVDAAFLAGQLEGYWKKTSPSDMEPTSLRQLQFFAAQAGAEDAPQYPIDTRLVERVQRKLTAYPPFKRYYKQLISEINAKTKPVTVDSVVKGSGLDELVGTHTVPGSFTIDGYRNFIQPVFDSNSAEISKDDWVMGSAAAGAEAHSNDIAELKSLYWNQYSDHWRQFLRGISVRPFKTPAEAVASLRVLSATDSPIAAVLAAVARHTQLSSKPKESGVWHWITSFFSSKAGQDTIGDTPVEREFAPLIEFVGSTESKKDAGAITQYRDELLQMGDRLENKTPEQLAETSKALLAGKDEIGLQKAEKTANRLLSRTPAATDAAGFLKQPIENTRALLYQGVSEQIDQEWTEVYAKAQQLESGYPFSDGSDASVADLSQFLNPVNGKFSVFLNKLLVTSIEGTAGQWRRKPSSSFRISDDGLKFLNDAGRLRDALFPDATSQQPAVSYQLTLQPEKDTEVTIDIYGKPVQTVGVGDQTIKFDWPAPPGSLEAKITVVPKTTLLAEPPTTFKGEWALFRLFDQGAPGPSAPYKLSWKVGSVVVHATLQPLTANHPFDRRLFRNLRAPQTIRMK